MIKRNSLAWRIRQWWRWQQIPKRFANWLCSIGLHKWRYWADAPWSLWSIYGKEDYKCEHCGKHQAWLYNDHPHEHIYPRDGSRGTKGLWR